MTPAPPTNVSPADPDIRPLVASEGRNWNGVFVFAAFMLAIAFLLFITLENHRRTLTETESQPDNDGSRGMISAPPDLTIPVDPYERQDTGPLVYLPVDRPKSAPSTAPAAAETRSMAPTRAPRMPRAPRLAPQPIPLPYIAPIPQNQPSYSMPQPIQSQPPRQFGNQQDRAQAFRFLNPSTTVPKGTIIQAVLETALDSTRPGFARAIVSHNVFGFDGSRVLIPRGSRLIGDYGADLAPGQNRALIQWQRLMRPDGGIVNLDSPATDPLGRAGVKGSVNSHFLERFVGAILQTALNIGSNLAISKVSSGTIVYAIPLAGQASPLSSPDKVQRTLKVKQGKSVSVFVSKDLDFTTLDQ